MAEALRGPLRRTPAAWHSGLTSLERRETWRAIAEGRIGVVVGARSALFLPFADLGLIVVDEEHDTSFKQEDGVCYNARDMAVVRARLVGGADRAGLGHAVARERHERRAGRYGALHLPARHGGNQLADDRGRSISGASRPTRGRWLSPPVRRGDEADPGARASRRCCSSIAAAMRRSRSAAPAARASNARNARPGWSSIAFAACWSAIIAATAEPPARDLQVSAARSITSSPAVRASSGWPRRRTALFPEARVELFTSDTLMNRDEATAAVERMIAGEIDILIGTQMAAKGHHFPEPHPGRRDRRRSRPQRRRPARRRADLSAALSGRGPRRPRTSARAAP